MTIKSTLSISIVLLLAGVSECLSQNPGARDHHGLVYDSERNKVVLFAGSDVNESGEYTWNPSTWEWNGKDWEEADKNTAGPITSMGMVYDAGSEQVIVMGGANPSKGDLDETWIWNGVSWKQYKGNEPDARLSPAMAFDKTRNEIVLFSGCAGNSYPTDTWTFRDQQWRKASDSGPPGVCRGTMFYDESREQVLLFGGSVSTPSGWDFTNQMWAWNGQKWQQVDQGDRIPSPRSNMLIAYDENRKRAVLYGGTGSEGAMEDLWEWNGNEWHQIDKKEAWPGPREVYGITYHKKMKKVLLYGGRTSFGKPQSDFWSWDGNEWKQIH